MLPREEFVAMTGVGDLVNWVKLPVSNTNDGLGVGDSDDGLDVGDSDGDTLVLPRIPPCISARES